MLILSNCLSAFSNSSLLLLVVVSRLLVAPFATATSPDHVTPPAPDVKAYLERTEREIAFHVRDQDLGEAFDLAEDILFRIPQSPVGLKWLGIILQRVGMNRDAAVILSSVAPSLLAEDGLSALHVALGGTCDVELQVTAPPQHHAQVEQRVREALDTLAVADSSHREDFHLRIQALRANSAIPRPIDVERIQISPGVLVYTKKFVPAAGTRTLTIRTSDLRLEVHPADLQLELLPRQLVRIAVAAVPYRRVKFIGLKESDRLYLGEAEIPVDSEGSYLPPGSNTLVLRRTGLDVVVPLEPDIETQLVPATVVFLLPKEIRSSATLFVNGTPLLLGIDGAAAASIDPRRPMNVRIEAPRRIPKDVQYELEAGELRHETIELADLEFRPDWLAYEESESQRTQAWILAGSGIGLGVAALAFGGAALRFQSERDHLYGEYNHATTPEDLWLYERRTRDAHRTMETWAWLSLGTGILASGLIVTGVYLLSSEPSVDMPSESRLRRNRVTLMPGYSSTLTLSF